MGPSIKYVTLFLANFDPPLPPVTLCHAPRAPPESTSHISDPPIFSRPSTKILDKSPLYKFYLNCSRRFFSGGFCPGWFLFCPFHLLSQYICYNRKLDITLNFMFRIYDKNLYKRDITCSLHPLPLSQTVTPSRTPSPSSVTYFMDGPQGSHRYGVEVCGYSIFATRPVPVAQ